MRISIGAIVGPLDLPYVKEWLRYHAKLGIHRAYIGLNNWKSEDLAYLHDTDFGMECLFFRIDGVAQQIPAYNLILKKAILDEEHWCAFIDVDEFLKIRSGRLLEDVLADYSAYPGLGVNWRLYGSDGEIYTTCLPVQTRFPRCENRLNLHVKTIVNTDLWRDYDQVPVFMSAHNINAFIVNVDKQPFFGPFSKSNLDEVHEIELAHYFCKSREEFAIRRNAPRADDGTIRTDIWKQFAEHDKNDVDESQLVFNQKGKI